MGRAAVKGMKIVRWLLILALVGGYFIWPYQSTRKFAAAVEAKDAETIKSMTDFEALRESLLELSVEAAIAQAEKQLPAGKVNRESIRKSMQSMLENPAVKRQMEKLFTAEMLSRMLASGKGDQSSGSGWRNERWVSPVQFSVQDRDSEARAIFKFRGLGWKLCGLQVPPAEMARLQALSAAR